MNKFVYSSGNQCCCGGDTDVLLEEFSFRTPKMNLHDERIPLSTLRVPNLFLASHLSETPYDYCGALLFSAKSKTSRLSDK